MSNGVNGRPVLELVTVVHDSEVVNTLVVLPIKFKKSSVDHTEHTVTGLTGPAALGAMTAVRNLFWPSVNEVIRALSQVNGKKRLVWLVDVLTGRVGVVGVLAPPHAAWDTEKEFDDAKGMKPVVFPSTVNGERPCPVKLVMV